MTAAKKAKVDPVAAAQAKLDEAKAKRAAAGVVKEAAADVQKCAAALSAARDRLWKARNPGKSRPKPAK